MFFTMLVVATTMACGASPGGPGVAVQPAELPSSTPPSIDGHSIEPDDLGGTWTLQMTRVEGTCESPIVEWTYTWDMVASSDGFVEVTARLESSIHQIDGRRVPAVAQVTSMPRLYGRLGFDRVLRVRGSADQSIEIGTYGQVLPQVLLDLRRDPASPESLVGRRRYLGVNTQPTEADDLMIFPCIDEASVVATRVPATRGEPDRAP